MVSAGRQLRGLECAIASAVGLAVAHTRSSVPMLVVEAVHRHLVRLPAGDAGHQLLATPADALHRGTRYQLHETADDVL